MTLPQFIADARKLCDPRKANYVIREHSKLSLTKEQQALSRALDMLEVMHDALEDVDRERYPATVFLEWSEQDWGDLKSYLHGKGKTLDGLSGNYGRLLYRGVRKLAREALAQCEKLAGEKVLP